MNKKDKKITLRNFKKLYYEYHERVNGDIFSLAVLLKRIYNSLDGLLHAYIISINTYKSVSKFCLKECIKLYEELSNED